MKNLTDFEVKALLRNPHVLEHLLDYHDQQRVEAEAMLGTDELGVWPSQRFQEIYEHARGIMAEDLELWSDDLRKRFGFPLATVVPA